jgi:hypothetical protein
MSEIMNPVTFNADGWFNVLTGLGMSQLDKRVNTSFSMSSVVDDQTLIDLYRAEGLAKRVIDIPVGDMVREWFYIENDTDNKIIKALQKLRTKKTVKSALRWADLFGGSVVLMGINDGQSSMETPVNEERIREVKFLEVFDRRSIQWDPNDLHNNPNEDKYGKPKIYTITNPTTGMPFRVHESRVLRFEGEDLPDQERRNNSGWGDSRLQSVIERLTGVGDSLGGVEAINTEFIMGVMKVSNLQQLLSSKDGESALRDRLKVIDSIKHILNTVVIDKNEDFERVTSIGVSGLRDLIDVLIDVLCGISGIPRVKLIGDQSKGIGGGAEGNIRLYYDDIATRQEDDLQCQLETLCRYVAKSEKVSFEKADDIRIIFNGLWKPSDKEISETRLINSKADGVYIDAGLPAEYVFLSRFGGQSYNNNLILPEEYIKKIKQMSVEEAIQKVEEMGGNIRQTNMSEDPDKEGDDE